MRHRPPLKAARLAEIYDACPTEIVLELLWEIHRLRATVLRAHQIRQMIGDGVGAVPRPVWEAFTQTLDAEPCLSDPRTPRQQQVLDAMRDRANAGERDDRGTAQSAPRR